MDAALSVAAVHGVQAALALINAALQITGYLWLPSACVEDKKVYDYIVIGAGTAGSVVAARLAENKTLRILLIEAGGDPPLESAFPGLVSYNKCTGSVYNFTTENDGYTNQCIRGNRFTLSAGKMLGGTGSISYLSYERGNKEDYSLWAAAANDSSWEWPQLIKYFKKTETLKDTTIQNSPDAEFHGVDGPMVVVRENSSVINNYLQALKEVGNKIVLDLNSNTSTGYTKPMHIVEGTRYSTAFAFLTSPLAIPNLDIYKNTEVPKILFDENKTAVGVKALTKDNKIITVKAKREVILCAGAINTPKLLMLSGIGPRNHLEKHNIEVISDLPVGENYQDHVATLVVHKMGKGCKPLRPVDLHMLPYPFLLGYVSLNKSDTLPDYTATSYIMSSDTAAEELLQSCAFLQGFDYDICNKLYEESKGREILSTFIKKCTPKARGRLRLCSSNPKDDPVIRTGIFSEDSDLEPYRNYIQDFLQVVKSTFFMMENTELVDPMKKKCGRYPYGSDAYWRCYALCMMVPSGHVCGTCSLGTVVDSKLSVFGVRNLRVADASIIPNITVSGTYAPTVMIGEKAAAMILEDIK